MAFVYIVMNAADHNAIQEVFTSVHEAEQYVAKWNAFPENDFWYDDWQVDL